MEANKKTGTTINVLHLTWSADKAGMLFNIVKSQTSDPDLNLEVCFGTLENGFYYNRINNLGIKQYVLQMNSKYGIMSNLAGALRLRRILLERHYDIVHLQEAMLPFPFLAATKTLETSKTVLHNRGEFHLPDSNSQLLGQQVKKLVYKLLVSKQIDKLICNSEFVVKHTPITSKAKTKVVVLPNALDLAELEFVRKRKSQCRWNLIKELSLPDDVFIVSVVCRLVRVKRVDRFIKAMKRVIRHQNNVFGLIIGDGPLMGQLRSLVRVNDCNEKILFLGYRSDAKNIMAASDMTVLPSEGEAFGNSALESIVLNVPVVVFNDAGGPLDFVKNGENGFIVKDEIELSNIIVQASQKKTFLEKLLRENDISRKYDIRHYVNKIKQIYVSLLTE